jgi:Cu(I)/Ag(I) efflux system membrane protein CusA/SilA
VVRASEAVAALLRRIPGAADVVADPVRGKGYLEVQVRRDEAARLGMSVAEVNELVEIALGGTVATQTIEGRQRHPVRIRFPRCFRDDEEAVRALPVPIRRPDSLGAQAPELDARHELMEATARAENGGLGQVTLSRVADIHFTEGPAAIKSENGLLRNYVRLNVRGRSALDFVADARQAVASQIALPAGVYIEWTGQFEHQLHARRTLMMIVPVVVGLIFLVLYLTYGDLADACLMMLAVPGALAGGMFFQWLLGFPFSVTVWVGYISCFGMATATGIIMLVYLREAVARAGGLPAMTLTELRGAVMNGAVHRLRPKLLTEGTVIIGLAPLLWATGVGAEVIKPMAAPVLGGILIADEVIDLLLPVLFYQVRRWRWQRFHLPDSSLDELSGPQMPEAPAAVSGSASVGDQPARK